MSRFSFFLLLLSACSPYRRFHKNYDYLTESPCVDGTMLNLEEGKCEIFYWGIIPGTETIKIRCTYGLEDNFWTRSDFYITPTKFKGKNRNWKLYCQDQHTKIFVVTYEDKTR